jgi:hypothetical protein
LKHLEQTTNGITVTKNYYVPKYFKATWLHSKLTCSQYGLELAALESLEELDEVRKLCLNYPTLFTQWTHVDGMTLYGKSATDWYFSSGVKIPYAIPWHPSEPSFGGDAQWCLAVGNLSKKEFLYVDIQCSGAYEEKFLCQEIEAVTVEKESCKRISLYAKNERDHGKIISIY